MCARNRESGYPMHVQDTYRHMVNRVFVCTRARVPDMNLQYNSEGLLGKITKKLDLSYSSNQAI